MSNLRRDLQRSAAARAADRRRPPGRALGLRLRLAAARPAGQEPGLLRRPQQHRRRHHHLRALPSRCCRRWRCSPWRRWSRSSAAPPTGCSTWSWSALIAAVFFVQVEKRIFTSPTALIIVLALAFGAAVAYGLLRTRFVPQPARRARGRAGRLPGDLPLLQRHLEADPPAEQRQRPRRPGALAERRWWMVIFDEFPTATLLDRRQGGSTPGASRTSPRSRGRSTWYRNNTTVADFTGRAVPAIMTGNNPSGSDPADRLRPAEQHLQPARRRLSPPRQGGGHPGLPGDALRRGPAPAPALAAEEPRRRPQVRRGPDHPAALTRQRACPT